MLELLYLATENFFTRFVLWAPFENNTIANLNIVDSDFLHFNLIYFLDFFSFEYIFKIYMGEGGVSYLFSSLSGLGE